MCLVASSLMTIADLTTSTHILGFNQIYFRHDKVHHLFIASRIME